MIYAFRVQGVGFRVGVSGSGVAVGNDACKQPMQPSFPFPAKG
jgi:hypothetical protein